MKQAIGVGVNGLLESAAVATTPSGRQQVPLHRAIRRSWRDFRCWLVDSLGVVPTWIACWWLRIVRGHRIHMMPRTRSTFERVGVYPLRDHYYEPLIRRQNLSSAYRYSRSIPTMDWQEASQWSFLETLQHRNELGDVPLESPGRKHTSYYLRNGYFGPGDADVYYALIRSHAPRNIIEIGSGHSTRLAALAIERNVADGIAPPRMQCIEPYRHAKWFASLPVEHIAQPVEEVGEAIAETLGRGDILFIDSSHIIRPQGDVLYNIFELLPNLAPGVFVHIHDIFSPLDYPNEWLKDRCHFWNEQYLVEAFLLNNRKFRMVAALQYLLSRDANRLERLLPTLSLRISDIEFASLWLQTTE